MRQSGDCRRPLLAGTLFGQIPDLNLSKGQECVLVVGCDRMCAGCTKLC